MGFETQDVERKVLSILKVLSDSPEDRRKMMLLVILLGGLNPIAAAEEAGIEAENRAMSTVINYQNLVRFGEV